MATIIDPPNSIWPNGLKIDNEGYVTFYPLGTNKVDISTVIWPDGDKLIYPFVYKNKKLVGFCDTGALTVSSNTAIYLPYEHIEVNFSEIEKNSLQIHAPNATIKKVSWKNTGIEDIPEMSFKYKGCKTIDDVKAVDANYQTVDIVDGVWIEPLWDLENGKVNGQKNALFYDCSTLISFNSDLPNLTRTDFLFYGCVNLESFSSNLSNLTQAIYMFGNCSSLTTFSSKLSNLIDSSYMFSKCSALVSFNTDLSSLEVGNNMFYNCSALTSFNIDLPSLTYGDNMFYKCSALTLFNPDLPNLMSGEYMFAGCSALTSFSSNLSSLTKPRSMFAGCSSLASFNSDLSTLTNGHAMFSNCTSLDSFDSNLSSLTNGYQMFSNCTGLTSFSSDLPSLTNGYSMFNECSALTSFDSNLPSLTDAENMFNECTNLTTFTSDLSTLTNGEGMFSFCENLTSFSSNLTSLTNGYQMFYYCGGLKSFTSDLSSLTNGYDMFDRCTHLTSFSSNLTSLTNGRYMFYGCKLDGPSVKNVIDTINTYSGASLTLGMGCNNTTEDKDLFAQEAGYADMTSLLAALQAKGWTVTTQHNGRPTTTYGLRRPSEDTLPVFVKLEETEDRTDYTSEDSSKKYRLDWFHETTGSTEGYTQFNTLEEAIEHFNIKPIERN